MNKSTYKAKQFNLSGLNGISDQTMETHFNIEAFFSSALGLDYALNVLGRRPDEGHSPFCL